MARMAGPGGDPDRADLGVRVRVKEPALEFDIEGPAYEIIAPEEWYSDLYKDNVAFRCVDGFYPDAATAIEAFSKKGSDDIFGERYFPVISIDVNAPNSGELRRVADGAKSQSSAVVANGRLFFGLRCKPYEYGTCIEECYKMGGAVPVGATWDWS